MKNVGICEGCEHFVRMNDEHTYFVEHLICLSDDVLSFRPVEPHLPPQENCAFFKSAQHRLQRDELPRTTKAALPTKNILSRLLGLFSAIRR